MIYLDLLSTWVFALLGSQLLMRHRQPWFKVVMAGFLSAIGGGTARELLLLRGSFFWLEDLRYIAAILLALLCAYIMHRVRRRFTNTFDMLNALGTSTFIMVGIMAAMAQNCPAAVVVAMGVLTGVGGGLLRDQILLGQSSWFSNYRYMGVVLLSATVATCLLLAELNLYLTLLVTLALNIGQDKSDDRNRTRLRANQETVKHYRQAF